MEVTNPYEYNVGPILLDFPYVYKLDGNKLYCNAPSFNNPSGCCEGVIDYDPGFNYLHCTKCGVKYRAKELEAAIEKNNIIIKSQGGFKMKISISGGTKDINKTIVTGEYAEMAKSTPKQPVKKVDNTSKKNEVVEEKKVVEQAPVKEESKIQQCRRILEEEKKSASVESPISFDSAIKGNENETTVEKFNRILQDALDVFLTAKEEDKKEINDIIVDAFKDQILEAIPALETTPTEVSYRDVIDEIVDEKNDEMIQYFIDTLAKSETYDISIHMDEIQIEDGAMIAPVAPSIVKFTDDGEAEVWIRDIININYDIDSIASMLQNNGYNIEGKESDEDSPVIYNTCKYYAAKVVNVKDIFQEAQSSKIIVIIDEKGNYLTVGDGNVVAIDIIDDKSVEALSLVSSQWLDGVLKERDEKENEVEPEDVTVVPTGVLPPDMSINGVPVDNE